VRLPGADELFRTTGTAILKPVHSPQESTAERVEGDEAVQRENPRQLPGALRAVPSPVEAVPDRAPERTEQPAQPTQRATRAKPGRDGARGRSSGRQRHDEKITVYVSPEELLDLEHARISLRAEYGLVADRGRIVREAVAVLLADLEAKGEESILVQRLSDA